MPLKTNKGKNPRPRRCLLYGTPGIGKTTWAAKAPSPLFVDIEGGCSGLLDAFGKPLDVERTDQIMDWQSLSSTVQQLINEGGPWKTIVLDSIDWAERLLHRKLCNECDVKEHELHKASGGYGAGYNMAAARIAKMLDYLAIMQAKWNWTVILLGHVKTTRVDDPMRASYTQWSLDMHDKAAACVREWVDEMFFATTDVAIEDVDENTKNGKRTIAKGGGKRFIRTVGTPSVVAKNRLGMKEIIPLDNFEAYSRYWPGSGYTPPPAEPEPEPDDSKPAQLKTESEAETF
jgi:hypothetical protein